MMNDYQNNNLIDDLKREIQLLKEENHFLKEEVRRLNSSITGLNSQNGSLRDNVLNSPLVDYYLTRYNEIHEYVLNNRIAIIDEDIKKAEDEYTFLMSKEESLEEIAAKNKELQDKIDDLDNIISENEEKLKSLYEEFNREAETVTDLENNIYNATMDYYSNLVAKLSSGDREETREYTSFVMDVLRYTLYDEVVKYLNKAKKALKYLDEINVLECAIKSENTRYENERALLESGIEIISFDETEKKLDALAYEISSKKEAKEELKNLFDSLKKENIKNIKDEIKHLQILEYNNQQIAMKMDEIILDYRNNLSTADTNSNIILNKKILLQKLVGEFEKIQPYKEQYDRLSSEYNNFQNMHQTISNNIDDIEKFIENAKKIIEANPAFKQTLKTYDEIKVKKAAIKSNLDLMLLREKTLVETRKQILNNPYGKTDLINIDGELKDVQKSISDFESEILSLDTSMYRLKESEQDYKLITIYDETNMCEQKLPLLYEKQRNLASLISDKYVEVSSLKMKCENFDKLQRQIEELEDEINDI